MNPQARFVALGAATGARSSYGLAAVAVFSPPAAAGVLGRLTRPAGRKVVGVMAGLETVLDKLPMTPSRLQPVGLGLRILSGAGSAVLVARRDGDAVTDAARVGAIAAAATSVLGAGWRRVGVRRGRRDLSYALIEDGLAAALAVWGARPASRPPEPPA